MTPGEWEHIGDLFEQALSHPSDQREHFLEGLTGEPAEVMREVRSLLAEHNKDTPDIFNQGTQGLADKLAHVATSSPPPERIGPYQVKRELGRGGMGIVYLAHRADGQFEQEVALKVVRRGMDSAEVQQRFIFERQLLAKLQHAGIARLLDGGIDEDGRPYFALEYIDGMALFDYCDQKKLSIDRRLALFIKICDAVQYAHQSLIVHRDLKPSNILVTDKGEPRLLDFGIAKLLDVSDAAAASPKTRAGLSLLTPEYGAPEQFRGDPVTTAADVYALGVILYELLSGRRPYEFENRSAVAIYEALVNTDLERPSASIKREPASTGELAQRRRTTPPRLIRRLRGDLDVIAMTALAKEPTRRYPSAGALGQDIRRYLEQRPIQAREDSVAYRTGKFLRRHTLAVGATALVLMSLIGGLAAAAWQGRIAAREAAKADAVSTFLLGMLASANPDNAQGRDLTVRELVDAAALDLDGTMDSDLADPVVAAAIRSTLGSTLRSLGKYAAAAAQYEQAIALNDNALAASDPASLQAKSDLGATLFDADRIDDAERYYREVLDISERELGPHHEVTLEAKVRYAGIHLRRGELPAAEALLRETVDARARILGPGHSDTLTAQSNLATSIAHQGRFEESAVLFRETLAGLQKLHGASDRRALVTLDNLINLNKALGKHARAVELSEQSLALRSAILEPGHPALLETQSRLATAYQDAGRFAEAEKLYDDVLPAMRETLGEEHRNTMLARGNYALLQDELGQHDTALASIRAVVADLERVLGETHPLTAAMREEMQGLEPE